MDAGHWLPMKSAPPENSHAAAFAICPRRACADPLTIVPRGLGHNFEFGPQSWDGIAGSSVVRICRDTIVAVRLGALRGKRANGTQLNAAASRRCFALVREYRPQEKGHIAS